MDWPILVDSLNRSGVHAVPRVWAIDEHGVLQSMRPRPDWVLGEFLSTEYPKPTGDAATPAPLDEGVSKFFARDYDAAIASWQARSKTDAKSAETWFRLGCAYRRRHDASGGFDDFQRAIDAWTKALSLTPRNYIYRRRIQQYGPLLDKPYPFYDWVAIARKEIKARGEDPAALSCEPEGSELAGRIRNFDAAGDANEPDPKAEIPRDVRGLVAARTAIAPQPVARGNAARLYLRFAPNAERKASWDDAGGALTVWLDAPEGWQLQQRKLVAKGGKPSAERRFELELRVPEGSKPGTHRIKGYALFGICDGKSGECTYLRRDFSIAVQVVDAPPRPRRGRRRGRRR